MAALGVRRVKAALPQWVKMPPGENELYQHSLGMVTDEELEVQRNLLLLPHMQIEAVSQIYIALFSSRMRKEISGLLKERK